MRRWPAAADDPAFTVMWSGIGAVRLMPAADLVAQLAQELDVAAGA